MYPRFNGATYPTLAARKLKSNRWLVCNVSTKHVLLQDIDFTHEDWYDPKRKCGAVIMNWRCLSEGKLGVLAVGIDGNEPEIIKRLSRDVL